MSNLGLLVQELAPNEVNSMKVELKTFKVSQLRELTRAIGIKQLKRKDQFIESICVYIDAYVIRNDTTAIMAVKLLMVMATRRPDLPTFTAIYEGLNSGSLNYRSTLQEILGSSSSTNTPSSQNYRDNPRNLKNFDTPSSSKGTHDIVFIPSLFYDIVRLVPSTTDVEQGKANRWDVIVKFNLSEEDNELLKKDRSIRVYLLCGKLGHGLIGDISPKYVEYPEKMELVVDGKVLKDPSVRGFKNVEGTARPFDITDHLNTYRNFLKFMYVDKFSFAVSVKFCRKYTAEEVFKGATIPEVPLEQEILKIKTKFLAEDDISMGSELVSLKCPLTYARVSTPVKSIKCDHTGCFDAFSFLALQEQISTWKCPICLISIPFPDLRLSAYFKDILAKCDESVESVEINEDASWKRVTENKESHHNFQSKTAKLERTPLIEEIIISDSEDDEVAQPEQVSESSSHIQPQVDPLPPLPPPLSPPPPLPQGIPSDSMDLDDESLPPLPPPPPPPRIPSDSDSESNDEDEEIQAPRPVHRGGAVDFGSATDSTIVEPVIVQNESIPASPAVDHPAVDPVDNSTPPLPSDPLPVVPPPNPLSTVPSPALPSNAVSALSIPPPSPKSPADTPLAHSRNKDDSGTNILHNSDKEHTSLTQNDNANTRQDTTTYTQDQNSSSSLTTASISPVSDKDQSHSSDGTHPDDNMEVEPVVHSTSAHQDSTPRQTSTVGDPSLDHNEENTSTNPVSSNNPVNSNPRVGTTFASPSQNRASLHNPPNTISSPGTTGSEAPLFDRAVLLPTSEKNHHGTSVPSQPPLPPPTTPPPPEPAQRRSAPNILTEPVSWRNAHQNSSISVPPLVSNYSFPSDNVRHRNETNQSTETNQTPLAHSDSFQLARAGNSQHHGRLQGIRSRSNNAHAHFNSAHSQPRDIGKNKEFVIQAGDVNNIHPSRIALLHNFNQGRATKYGSRPPKYQGPLLPSASKRSFGQSSQLPNSNQLPAQHPAQNSAENSAQNPAYNTTQDVAENKAQSTVQHPAPHPHEHLGSHTAQQKPHNVVNRSDLHLNVQPIQGLVDRRASSPISNLANNQGQHVEIRPVNQTNPSQSPEVTSIQMNATRSRPVLPPLGNISRTNRNDREHGTFTPRISSQKSNLPVIDLTTIDDNSKDSNKSVSDDFTNGSRVDVSLISKESLATAERAYRFFQGQERNLENYPSDSTYTKQAYEIYTRMQKHQAQLKNRVQNVRQNSESVISIPRLSNGSQNSKSLEALKKLEMLNQRIISNSTGYLPEAAFQNQVVNSHVQSSSNSGSQSPQNYQSLLPPRQPYSPELPIPVPPQNTSSMPASTVVNRVPSKPQLASHETLKSPEVIEVDSTPNSAPARLAQQLNPPLLANDGGTDSNEDAPSSPLSSIHIPIAYHRSNGLPKTGIEADVAAPASSENLGLQRSSSMVRSSKSFNLNHGLSVSPELSRKLPLTMADLQLRVGAKAGMYTGGASKSSQIVSSAYNQMRPNHNQVNVYQNSRNGIGRDASITVQDLYNDGQYRFSNISQVERPGKKPTNTVSKSNTDEADTMKQGNRNQINATTQNGAIQPNVSESRDENSNNMPSPQKHASSLADDLTTPKRKRMKTTGLLEIQLEESSDFNLSVSPLYDRVGDISLDTPRHENQVNDEMNTQ